MRQPSRAGRGTDCLLNKSFERFYPGFVEEAPDDRSLVGDAGEFVPVDIGLPVHGCHVFGRLHEDARGGAFLNRIHKFRKVKMEVLLEILVALQLAVYRGKDFGDIPGEQETIMVVSEEGYGKRSQVEDYRVTNRGAKGVKTLNITEKTGRLVAIKNVTDENDLMIINKSGIVIRLAVADCRVMGRATQGVRLINLTKKNDVIASVCKVMSSELEAVVEQKSREEWAQNSEAIRKDVTAEPTTENNTPIVDFVDDETVEEPYE